MPRSRYFIILSMNSLNLQVIFEEVEEEGALVVAEDDRTVTTLGTGDTMYVKWV